MFANVDQTSDLISKQTLNFPVIVYHVMKKTLLTNKIPIQSFQAYGNLRRL